MLSRRRSSERLPRTEAAPTSQARLESALRSAHILFSVTAQQVQTTSTHLSVSQSLPRPPASSGDLDAFPVRRLFHRESRDKRRNNTAPVHRLVVAASAKHAIRMHQLLDYGALNRVIVQKTWNLSDLRKIDGLGMAVSESTHFALYFASTNKTLIWRATSPQSRATFLWSLLQTCVSRLSRAPPAENLSLLELQQMAENPDSKPLSPDDQDLSASVNFAGSDPSHLRLASKPVSERDTDSGTPHRNPAISSPFKVPEPSRGARVSGVIPQFPSPPLQKSRMESSDKRKARNARRQASSTQHVKRTLSEPKAQALVTDEEQRSDTSGDSPKQPGSPSKRRPDPNLKELNIDERAFLAAAKRLGARRSFELKRPDPPDKFARTDDEQNPPPFPHGVHAADASTAKVMAEHRMKQERKQNMLSVEEQNDLQFALRLFAEHKNGASLHEFGTWAEGYIQSLEVDNISDIVNVEKRPQRCYATHANGEPETENGNAEQQKTPYEILAECMSYADPWLKKCETLLSPYAALIDDINSQIVLLDAQRRNAEQLDQALADLLGTICFSSREQKLLRSLDSAGHSLRSDDLNAGSFYDVVQLITSRSRDLTKLESLSAMESVAGVQESVALKQQKASAYLLPVLKKYIVEIYRQQSESNFRGYYRYLKNVRDGSEPEQDCEELQEFRKGVKSLSIFRSNAFNELLDNFIMSSQPWIVHFLHTLMGRRRESPPGVSDLDTRLQQFSESLLYVNLVEGNRVYDLFTNILDASEKEGLISVSTVLQRQFSDLNVVNGFITGYEDDDKTRQACLYLHASYMLEHTVDQVRDSSYEELKIMAARVECVLELNASESPPEREGELASAYPDHDTACSDVTSNVQEQMRGSLGSIASNSSQAVPPSSSSQGIATAYSMSSVKAATQSYSVLKKAERPVLELSVFSGRHDAMIFEVLSRDEIILKDALSSFEQTCSTLSLACRSLAERYVGIVVSSTAHPRDVETKRGRAGFFSSVKNAVDLCCELAAPAYQAEYFTRSQATPQHRTISLCEKLIAAAMRSAEVTASSGSTAVSDILRMQFYGYIGAKLGECERPGFLKHLAEPPLRGRKQVVARWAEHHIFESLFGNLKIDLADKLEDTHVQFEALVQSLDASRITAGIMAAVQKALESASDTCAFTPVLSDIVSLTKDKMEELLKKAKKEKALAESRSALLAFSRELIGSLRKVRKSKAPCS